MVGSCGSHKSISDDDGALQIAMPQETYSTTDIHGVDHSTDHIELSCNWDAPLHEDPPVGTSCIYEFNERTCA